MATQNTFYTPEQVASTAVALAVQDSYLGALVNRNFENDLLGGGGKGRTVNVRVPSALIARSRGIDDTTSQIILDSLSERTIPVTLGEHLYNAIGLSEGDLTLNLASFAAQVLAPQVEAVVDSVEHEVAEALLAVEPGVQAGESKITYDPANPIPAFTAIRKVLRDRGVPVTGINMVVGTEVYAHLLDAEVLTDVSKSGSTAALREGSVGAVRGFTVAESTRIGENDLLAFHGQAFTLAVRAPIVPAGASFGASVSSGGYALRYLRDYDVMHTLDRSLVSTFAGVARMPLFKIARDYDATTAGVVEVPGGAVLRLDASNTAAQ